MERQRVALCVIAMLCLCLCPGVTPALEPTSWGFTLENGDVNGDQDRDVSDGIYLLSHLFLGGPAPVPLAYCGGFSPAVTNGDSNGNGQLDVSDPIQILSWLYVGGVEPVVACGEGEGAAAGAGNGKAKGVPRVSPPNSKAFGKSLAQWMEIYWRWAYGGGSNMVKNVELLQLPAGVQVGGSGTPEDPAHYVGEIDIDLKPGTPFVLPEFAWIAEKYNNGTPDDPCIPDSIMLPSVSSMSLTIDGMLVISDANKEDFYTSCTPFVPPVVYTEPSSYGSIEAIAFQGAGFVSPPLPVGDHVIKLYEQWVFSYEYSPTQIFSVAVIYDNTWNLHVKP